MEYQKPAFEKLLRICRAAQSAIRHQIPIKQRTNTLVIGSSGSGKTHLANAVANHFGEGGGRSGIPMLHLSAHEWIPLGASSRGCEITWKQIARFLLDTSPITESLHGDAPLSIIFVDELCKLTGTGDWNGYLLSELLSLCDKRFPLGIKDEDGDAFSAKQIERIKDVLTNRTLILAAGAFQHIWEDQSKSQMGFGRNVNITTEPNPTTLVGTLPRELINRFRSDIVILPQPQQSDYQDMLLRSSEVMPPEMQGEFLKLGESRIDRAIECRSGFRFIEELLLDFLVDWEDRGPKLEWKNIPTESPDIRLQLCEKLVEKYLPQPAKTSKSGISSRHETLSGFPLLANNTLSK